MHRTGRSFRREGLLIGSRPNSPGTGVPGNQLEVLKLKPDAKSADGKLEPFLDARFTRANAQFSPDGKWVAFASNQTGVNEIYIVPYPAAGGIVQISTGGGTQPRWNRNGRELFFRNGDKMMAVDVDPSGPAMRAGTPKMLFEKASADYDVDPNGRRFLMLKPAPAGGGGQASELHVILNWFDELRRRVPLPE